jgi:hypothetical protein
MALTAAERKRIQRQHDKILGYVEVTVKVGADYACDVRDFAAGLPKPRPPSDPNQISMLADLDAALSGRDASQLDKQQSLF